MYFSSSAANNRSHVSDKQSVCRLCCRAAVKAYLSDTISLYVVDGLEWNLAQSIHHASRRCWKGLQGQRSMSDRIIVKWNVRANRCKHFGCKVNQEIETKYHASNCVNAIFCSRGIYVWRCGFEADWYFIHLFHLEYSNISAVISCD